MLNTRFYLICSFAKLCNRHCKQLNKKTRFILLGCAHPLMLHLIRVHRGLIRTYMNMDTLVHLRSDLGMKDLRLFLERGFKTLIDLKRKTTSVHFSGPLFIQGFLRVRVLKAEAKQVTSHSILSKRSQCRIKLRWKE